MSGSKRYLFIFCIFVISSFSKIASQEEKPIAHSYLLSASLTDKSPTVDGRLTDKVWEQASPISNFTEVEPRTGQTPVEKTIVKVLTDQSSIYFAIQCSDADPESLVATVMARDGSLSVDDHLTIVLDSFGDRRNGYLFRVNPNGAREDGLISNNLPENKQWDGIWKVKTSIDSEGWNVEIEIPLKTLNFEPSTSTWGVNFERVVKRKHSIIRWAGAQPRHRINNLSIAGSLTDLKGLKQGIGLQFSPYLLLDYEKNRRTNREDFDTEGGFDLRYSLTPNLISSISYNTDFAETEVDARQINLTRFPLFFPEKREFFLEDESIFKFSNLNSHQLIPFFSRRIGLSSEGKVVPLLTAAKLTGRIQDTNIGILNAVLDKTADSHEENAFVGRLSQNLLDHSSLGMIVTHGDPNSNQENLLAGTDFNFHSGDSIPDWTLDGSIYGLGTYTEDLDGDSLAFGVRATLQNDDVITTVNTFQIDRDFNPALGFAPRRGVRAYEYECTFRPLIHSSTWLRRYFLSFFTSHYTDMDNHLETALYSLTWFYFQFESGDEFFFNHRLHFDRLEESFEIHPDISIDPGKYWFSTYRLGLITSSKRPLSFLLAYEIGPFYTGNKNRATAEIFLNMWKHLTLGLNYEINQIQLPEGDFTTRLASIRIQMSATPDLTWTHFIQYDTLSDKIGLFSRLRWEFQPGMEFYWVVNQALNREGGNARLEEFQSTTKVGLAIRF